MARQPGQRGEHHDLRQIDGKAGIDKLPQVFPFLEEGDKGQGENGEVHDPQEVGGVGHHRLVADPVAIDHMGQPKCPHHPIKEEIHPLFITDNEAQQCHTHQQQKPQRRGKGVVPHLP